MKTAEEYLRPHVGPNPPHLMYYANALAAVQAVIDHYNPPLPKVFAPACIRCTQRPDQCICPPLFPEKPLF